MANYIVWRTACGELVLWRIMVYGKLVYGGLPVANYGMANCDMAKSPCTSFRDILYVL